MFLYIFHLPFFFFLFLLDPPINNNSDTTDCQTRYKSHRDSRPLNVTPLSISIVPIRNRINYHGPPPGELPDKYITREIN